MSQQSTLHLLSPLLSQLDSAYDNQQQPHLSPSEVNLNTSATSTTHHNSSFQFRSSHNSRKQLQLTRILNSTHQDFVIDTPSQSQEATRRNKQTISLETTKAIEDDHSPHSLHMGQSQYKVPENARMRATVGFAPAARQAKHANAYFHQEGLTTMISSSSSENRSYICSSGSKTTANKRLLQLNKSEKTSGSFTSLLSHSKGSPTSQKKQQKITLLDHSYGLPVLVTQKSPTNKECSSISFKDMSNLDKHRVNRVDEKLSEKEYYDTSLLTTDQIDQFEIIRANKKSLNYTYQDDRLPYGKDAEFMRKKLANSSLGVGLDLLDLNKSNLTVDEVKELIDPCATSTATSSIDSSQRVPHPVVSSIGLKCKNTTSRKDAQDLEDWMTEMTTKLLADTSLDALQLFTEVQQVYSACLHELSRQVSLQCVERGALMKKIWNSYICLFKKIIKFKSDENLKHEKRHLEESKRIHKNYALRIEDLESRLREVNEKEVAVRDRYNQTKSLNSHYLKTMMQLECQFAQKQQDHVESQQQLMRVQNEHTKMMIFLRDKGFHEFLKNVSDRNQHEEFKRNEFMAALDTKQPEAKDLVHHFRSQTEGLKIKSSLNAVGMSGGNDKVGHFGEDLLVDLSHFSDSPRAVLSDPNLYFMNTYEISQDHGNSKGTDTNELNLRSVAKQKKILQKLRECQKQIKIYQQEYINQETEDDSNLISRESRRQCSIAQLRVNNGQSCRNTMERIDEQNEREQKGNTNQACLTGNVIPSRVGRSNRTGLQSNANMNSSIGEIGSIVMVGEQDDCSCDSVTSLMLDKKQVVTVKNVSPDESKLNKSGSSSKSSNKREVKGQLKKQMSFNKPMKSQKFIGKAGAKKNKSTTHLALKVQFEVDENDETMLAGFMQEFFQESKDIVGGELGEEKMEKVYSTMIGELREIAVNNNQRSADQLEKFLRFFENSKQYYNKKLRQLNSKIQKGISHKETNGTIANIIDGGSSIVDTQVVVQSPDGVKQKQAILAEETMSLLASENEANLSVEIRKKVEQWKQFQAISSKQTAQTTEQPSVVEHSKPSSRYLNTSGKNKIHVIEEDYEDNGDEESERVLQSKQAYYFAQSPQMIPQLRDVLSQMTHAPQSNMSSSTASPAKRNSSQALIGLPQSSTKIISNISPRKSTTKLQRQTSIQTLQERVSSKKPVKSTIPSSNTISLGKSALSTKRLPESLENQRQSTTNIMPEKRRGGIIEKKKVERSNVSPNLEAASKLVSQIVSKRSSKAVSATVSRVNLIKFISSVYIERIRVPLNINNKVSTIAYDFLLNKYGLRKVAEKKLTQFFESVYAYLNASPRIKLFARFSGLCINSNSDTPDCSSLEQDEFNFFINILKAMDEKTNSGIGLLQNYQDRIIVSLEKMVDHLSAYFSKEEQEKPFQQITLKLQSVSFLFAGQPVIDLDESFNAIVQLYQRKREEVENNVKKLFYAADLDKNDCIELREFLTIYRYLEPESFEQQEVSKVFFEAADAITDDGEKALTLERFATVCLENKLFSIAKQKEFALAYHEDDYVKSIEDLQRNCQRKFKDIKARLLFAKSYTQEFTSIIESLLQLLSPQYFQENTQKDMLWISYRLLDEDSKRLFVIALADTMIPEPLIMLSAASKDNNEDEGDNNREDSEQQNSEISSSSDDNFN